ncbi:spore maturation protein [Aminicella lysinilytica]|uniref:Spore maturation protein B n=1 Tax=Aminicella lysinilytica TaxID=433323 RepID=A0A4V3CRS6_9FIRM|nr:spore maturation protein [Aminicella lysinilytica]TDP57932.1 spore maturation protein B [Aminicella lysinilytica]
MFITIMDYISKYALPVVICGIPLYAICKKVRVYEVFCEGAKEGFNVAVSIIPFLVCMLCAIGMFRQSGAMDILVKIIDPLTSLLGCPGENLPMMIMRSFSGGAAQGMMADLFKTYGVDSQIGRIASVGMGSTETTFYVIAVYFGCVGVTKVRHAIAAGLMADLASFIAAVLVVNIIWY